MFLISALETQQKDLKSISNDIKAVESKISAPAPIQADVTLGQNKTLESLQELRYEINAKSEKTAVKINSKIQELEEKLIQNQQDLMKNVGELGEMTENVYSSVGKSYESLRGEVQALGKMEKVLVQSADNVMDTKRRVEYGVHQILLEVGELVKTQSKEISSTLNDR